MKDLSRPLTVAFFVLVTWGFTLATQKSDDEFCSLSGRFAIRLPQTYSEFKPMTPLKVSGRDYNVSLYKWNTQSGLITVGYAIGGLDLEQPAQTKVFLGDFRKLFLSRLGEGGRLISEKKLSLETHPGFELITESPGLITAVRVFLVRNRFYMVTLALQPSQRDFITSGEQVLSSFRMMSPAEVTERRDRLIGNFEVSVLPQEPFLSRPKSDLEDESLKEKVKQVLVEEEPFYGANLFDNRSPVELRKFDERGYLTTVVGYAGDFPASVTVYGYANRTRVSRKSIEANAQLIADRRKDVSPTRKTIQSMREIKFKYDDSGKLVERAAYEDNRKLAERTNYKYADKKREADAWNYLTFFGVKTNSHWKTIETLDEKGNVVESTEIQYQTLPDNYYSSTAPDPITNPTSSGTMERKMLEDKYAYTYDYDLHGNWIRRVTVKLVKEKGMTVSVPIKVTHRMIIYY